MPLVMNRLLLPVLVFCAAAAAILALSSGVIGVDSAALLALFPGSTAGDAGQIGATALLQLRLPRVVLALLIGAALAESGAVTQALFRNPLAEPSLIGVAAGAALAAAIVFTLIGSSPALTAYLLPIAAFAGGLGTAWLVLRLTRWEGQTRMSTLLLAGAAVNAFVAAAVGLLAVRADDTALRSFTLWMFGNLGRAGWQEIAVVAPALVAVIVWLPREARGLDALLLGESEALYLGVPVEALKRRILILAVLATACAVSLAGIIGFIGLIVPHAIRLLVGPRHRLLLPASALLGATLLTLADTAARTLNAPAELPVGTLTALLGAPFFLILLLRQQNTLESV